MKKNILIVQSLLVLPLITSNIALSMENPIEATEKKTEFKQTMSDEEIAKQQATIRQNHSPVFAQLRNRFENKPTHIKSIPKSEYASSKPITIVIPTEEIILPTIYLTSPETKIINISQPEPTNVPTNTPEMPSDLLQSIMLPTEAKELTFFEKLSYHTSTAHQLLKRMISYLENDQFEVDNLKHFEWLYEAIETATTNKDVASLTKIAALCQEKYATTIRIPERLAQPAAEVLHAHYSLELSLANKKLQEKRQDQMTQWNFDTAACVKAINDIVIAYNQSIKENTDNFETSVTQETERIKNLRREVSTFASLNREIRENTAKLLQNNPIQAPKNIFARTMGESQKRLNNLTNTVNEMPTINDFKKSDKLALQNK